MRKRFYSRLPFFVKQNHHDQLTTIVFAKHKNSSVYFETLSPKHQSYFFQDIVRFFFIFTRCQHFNQRNADVSRMDSTEVFGFLIFKESALRFLKWFCKKFSRIKPVPSSKFYHSKKSVYTWPPSYQKENVSSYFSQIVDFRRTHWTHPCRERFQQLQLLETR